MLKFMREKFQYSLPLKIILIAVAVTFVGWGIGTGGRKSQTSSIIAEVVDQKITFQEFQHYYNNIIESYRRQLGERFSPELLEQMNVKNGAFNTLVQQKLQVSIALQKGFKVSDEEVMEKIRSTPAFQRNGIFEPQLYRDILRANRLQPGEYEESLKQQLLIDKLHLLITDSVKVSDLEVRQAYINENEKVKVSYIAFDGSTYREQLKPAPEELQKYYEENKEYFKKPESVKIKYLKFPIESYISGIELTEEDARNYYDDNQEEFRRGEMVRARHILIKVAEKASEPEWEKAKVRAEELLKKINEGEDFGKLAKEVSQDTASKDKGGDLGFFPRGRMAKPFEEAAFTLEPGEVSKPIRSLEGYHIIRTEEKQPEGTEPFESVKDTIVGKLKKEKASEMAEDKAYSISNEITAEDFDRVAAQEKLTPQVSDWFFKGAPIGGIPGSFKMAQEAFKLQMGDITSASDEGGNYYVFTLLEKRDPFVPEFNEIEAQVRSSYVNKKSSELAEESAKEAISKLNAGKALQEIAKEYKLEPKETDFFTRNDSPKDVGRNPQFVQKAFQLKPDEFQMVISGPRYFLITRSGAQGIDEAKFQEEKEKFRKELLEKKRELMYRTWLTRTADRVKVKMVGDFTL